MTIAIEDLTVACDIGSFRRRLEICGVTRVRLRRSGDWTSIMALLSTGEVFMSGARSMEVATDTLFSRIMKESMWPSA